MGLEKIVRPFQTRVNKPPIKLQLSGNQKTPENVVLRIGVNPSGKVLTGSFSSSLSVYMDKAAVEKPF